MSEVYTCKFCGTEIDWEGADDQRGTIWGCEKEGCGKEFCAACFDKRHGCGSFHRSTNYDDIIRCPDCWKKHKNKMLDDLFALVEIGNNDVVLSDKQKERYVGLVEWLHIHEIDIPFGINI